MKTFRPILIMILFLGLAFFMDYLLDFALSGQSAIFVNPLTYYWISFGLQMIFGALCLFGIYYTSRKEWLTTGTAIAYIVVGGIILLYTPLWITFTKIFPAVMDSIYLKNPDFIMPAFWARSFFTCYAIFVLFLGLYQLLPKPKKTKK